MNERWRYDDVVITGGPCCGKSSVIRELSARGHDTIPEAARLYFDQCTSLGISPDEARETYDFVLKIANRQWQAEQAARDGEVTFYDRGLGDCRVYADKCGSRLNQERLHADAVDRYDVVFVLEPIPFTNDEARTETEAEARELHEAIRQEYIDLGYEVIDVPLMPVDERADFIEKRSHFTPPKR